MGIHGGESGDMLAKWGEKELVGFEDTPHVQDC